MSTEAMDNLRRMVGELAAAVIELSAQPADVMPKLVTLEFAAEILAVSRTTMQELIDNGSIPVVSVTGRAVRVDVRDLEAYIKAKRARR